MAQLFQSVSGKELSDALIDNSLSDLIEPCQAVYFWRRNLVPPRHVISNTEQFAQWLQVALEKPYARVHQKQMAHFLTLPGFDIGGGSLTEAKIEDLKPWLQSSRRRKWTVEFLSGLSDLTPPLYVGETMNLRARIQQHLTNQTDFSRVLAEAIRLTWGEVTLHYCRLGQTKEGEEEDETGKDQRTLLELIAARLVVAGCTSRPG